jgi:hypothetical protein
MGRAVIIIIVFVKLRKAIAGVIFIRVFKRRVAMTDAVIISFFETRGTIGL